MKRKRHNGCKIANFMPYRQILAIKLCGVNLFLISLSSLMAKAKEQACSIRLCLFAKCPCGIRTGFITIKNYNKTTKL